MSKELKKILFIFNIILVICLQINCSNKHIPFMRCNYSESSLDYLNRKDTNLIKIVRNIYTVITDLAEVKEMKNKVKNIDYEIYGSIFNGYAGYEQFSYAIISSDTGYYLVKDRYHAKNDKNEQIPLEIVKTFNEEAFRDSSCFSNIYLSTDCMSWSYREWYVISRKGKIVFIVDLFMLPNLPEKFSSINGIIKLLSNISVRINNKKYLPVIEYSN